MKNHWMKQRQLKSRPPFERWTAALYHKTGGVTDPLKIEYSDHLPFDLKVTWHFKKPTTINGVAIFEGSKLVHFTDTQTVTDTSIWAGYGDIVWNGRTLKEWWDIR